MTISWLIPARLSQYDLFNLFSRSYAFASIPFHGEKLFIRFKSVLFSVQ